MYHYPQDPVNHVLLFQFACVIAIVCAILSLVTSEPLRRVQRSPAPIPEPGPDPWGHRYHGWGGRGFGYGGYGYRGYGHRGFGYGGYGHGFGYGHRYYG